MFALYIKRFEFRMKFVYFIFNCKQQVSFTETCISVYE